MSEEEAVAKTMRDISAVVGPAMDSNFHQNCIRMILGTLFQTGRLSGIREAAKAMTEEEK